MTQKHPVIPTEYMLDAWRQHYQQHRKSFNEILIEVAQYGADIELEECCKLFKSNSVCGTKFQRESSVRDLRNRRRPKPKEVSLTVTIAGTEEELHDLITKLTHDKKISYQF